MKGSVKRFRPSDVNPRPYKAQNPSPLRDLLFLNGNPKYIRVDPAHTFAIDGIGKDYYASSVILLMMIGWFGNGNTDLKFNNACYLQSPKSPGFVDSRGALAKGMMLQLWGPG